MTDRQRLGRRGEDLAAALLARSGLRVIGRNVRLRAGEIDLVAVDGHDVVFIEVRTRRAERGAASESIDRRKIERMWRCALEYCEREGIDPDRARLDLLALDLPARAGGGRPSFDHYRGIGVEE